MAYRTFGIDLERAREGKGLSGSQLASLLGVSPNAVHKWENDKTFPKPDKWKAIEAVTGINPQKYKDKDRFSVVGEMTVPKLKITGAATSKPPEPSNVTPAYRNHPPRRVPLISWVEAGDWQFAADPFQPGDADEWLDTDATKSDNAFALTVHGDSMEPEFRDGDIIVVDPEREPSNGSYIIAKNGLEATFKQYVTDGSSVFLKPLNNRYPIRDMTGIEFRVVGVVVEKRKRY